MLGRNLHGAGIAGDNSIGPTYPIFVGYGPLGRLYNAPMIFYEHGSIVTTRLPCGCLDRMVCTYEANPPITER